MAFLDNSGDIILDAVLTDTGRLRLAQGDGSFKISKFALGDDEINYELYNKTHANGSAYYDLEVLQTPVLEAFTNNTSNLKSKLISLSRTNVLYMPTMKLNENSAPEKAYQEEDSKMFARGTEGGDSAVSDGKFYVCVDQKTWNAVRKYRDINNVGQNIGDSNISGIIMGFVHEEGSNSKRLIRVDQGLNTNEISPNLGMDSDLYETAYIVETDYRLGRVKPVKSHTPAAVNFIDDDNIASYYLTSDEYVNPKIGEQANESEPAKAQDNDGKKTLAALSNINPQVFAGPRGSTLHFRLQASQELQSSTYLFTQIGSSQASNVASGNILGFRSGASDTLIQNATTYYIDSTVRVVGANTGFRLDIPVRYIKVDY
jgi:hypothetical protein